jgi:hypothetical protein
MQVANMSAVGKAWMKLPLEETRRSIKNERVVKGPRKEND